jgi:hypothetical protein
MIKKVVATVKDLIGGLQRIPKSEKMEVQPVATVGEIDSDGVLQPPYTGTQSVDISAQSLSRVLVRDYATGADVLTNEETGTGSALNVDLDLGGVKIITGIGVRMTDNAGTPIAVDQIGELLVSQSTPPTEKMAVVPVPASGDGAIPWFPCKIYARYLRWELNSSTNTYVYGIFASYWG